MDSSNSPISVFLSVGFLQFLVVTPFQLISLAFNFCFLISMLNFTKLTTICRKSNNWIVLILRHLFFVSCCTSWEVSVSSQFEGNSSRRLGKLRNSGKKIEYWSDIKTGVENRKFHGSVSFQFGWYCELWECTEEQWREKEYQRLVALIYFDSIVIWYKIIWIKYCSGKIEQ